MKSEQVLPPRVSVDLGVILTKDDSTLPITLKLEPPC